MKSSLFILTLLLAGLPLLQAQDTVAVASDTASIPETLAIVDTTASADSLQVKKECRFVRDWKRPCPGGEVHRFRATTLIAPTLMFATGASIAFNPYLKRHVDMEVTDVMYTRPTPRIRVEDYVQYTPAVAPYVLNLCGLKGQHGYRDLLNLTAASYLFSVSMLWPIKYTVGVERPNSHNKFSFPSGHTVTAFTGAEILRREYREYPFVGICGYAVAATVGALRIYHGYHWFSDVLAGAAIGILGTSIAYWLAPYLRF